MKENRPSTFANDEWFKVSVDQQYNFIYAVNLLRNRTNHYRALSTAPQSKEQFMYISSICKKNHLHSSCETGS